MIKEVKLPAIAPRRMHDTSCSGCQSYMMSSPMDTRDERDRMIKVIDNYIANLEAEIEEERTMELET